MKIAIVNSLATNRILKCTSGMAFIIDSQDYQVAHVRDYRYDGDNEKYCIWSLSSDMYYVIEE